MQEHAAELASRHGLATRQGLVDREVAVLVVTHDGVAFGHQVHTNLVRAAGLDGHIEQGEVLELLRHLHQGDRTPAVFVIAVDGAHPALALSGQKFVQRHVDHGAGRWPGTDHQGRVGLAGLALPELLLQCHQGRALLGDQQQPGGFLVEPVDQLQEAGRRPRPPQLFNDAEADAAAAMHRHAGRLVDGQEMLIFEDHVELTWRDGRTCAAIGGTGRGAHWRHPHLVAQGQAGVGMGTAFVDAHFTRADDAIHMGLGHTLEQLDQKIVEPLALRAFVDADIVHSRSHHRLAWGWLCRGGWAWFGPYNATAHVAAVSG